MSNRRSYDEARLCPRCMTNPLPVGHVGALSRADNKTEICPKCGVDEAMQQFFQRGEARRNGLSAILAQPKDWPVRIVYDDIAEVATNPEPYMPQGKRVGR